MLRQNSYSVYEPLLLERQPHINEFLVYCL
ncbi:hypothetical protein VPHD51_0195 [Vibrio phage D51]